VNQRWSRKTKLTLLRPVWVCQVGKSNCDGIRACIAKSF